MLPQDKPTEGFSSRIGPILTIGSGFYDGVPSQYAKSAVRFCAFPVTGCGVCVDCMNLVVSGKSFIWIAQEWIPVRIWIVSGQLFSPVLQTNAILFYSSQM